jgi:hypothetical protein
VRDVIGNLAFGFGFRRNFIYFCRLCLKKTCQL